MHTAQKKEVFHSGSLQFLQWQSKASERSVNGAPKALKYKNIYIFLSISQLKLLNNFVYYNNLYKNRTRYLKKIYSKYVAI